MQQFFQQIIEEFRLPLSSPVLIFSVILFIILFASLAMKKFNLPGIIGLIISGVVMRQNGLNIVTNDSAIHFLRLAFYTSCLLPVLGWICSNLKSTRTRGSYLVFLSFFCHSSLVIPSAGVLTVLFNRNYIKRAMLKI